MSDWFAQHIFSSLAGWLGLGSLAIAALLAVAWFFPPFRKVAVAAAIVIGSALAIYAKGSRDAAKRKQAEWDKANKRSIDKANKARADAERDVAAGRVRGSEWDRDKR